MHNIGNKPVELNAGDKIVQAIMLPIISASLVEVPENELYKNILNTSTREDGCFGSTGTN